MPLECSLFLCVAITHAKERARTRHVLLYVAVLLLYFAGLSGSVPLRSAHRSALGHLVDALGR